MQTLTQKNDCVTSVLWWIVFTYIINDEVFFLGSGVKIEDEFNTLIPFCVFYFLQTKKKYLGTYEYLKF